MLEENSHNLETPQILSSQVADAMAQFQTVAESDPTVLRLFEADKKTDGADLTRPSLRIWPEGIDKCVLRMDTNIQMDRDYPLMTWEVEFHEAQTVTLNDEEELSFFRVVLTNEYSNPSQAVEVATRFNIGWKNFDELDQNEQVTVNAQINEILDSEGSEEDKETTVRNLLSEVLLNVQKVATHNDGTITPMKRSPGYHITLYGRLQPKYSAAFKQDDSDLPTDKASLEELEVTSQVLDLLYTMIPGMEDMSDEDTVFVPDPVSDAD